MSSSTSRFASITRTSRRVEGLDDLVPQLREVAQNPGLLLDMKHAHRDVQQNVLQGKQGSFSDLFLALSSPSLEKKEPTEPKSGDEVRYRSRFPVVLLGLWLLLSLRGPLAVSGRFFPTAFFLCLDNCVASVFVV